MPRRTRPAALLASVVAAGTVAAACGGGDDATARTAVATTPEPVRVEQAIGQRIVTGYRGAKPTVSVLKAVREGRVGGVILFADNVPTPKVAQAAVTLLQQAAASLGQPPLLVMIDQEGGSVKRLPTLPPTATPARMGIAGGPAKEATAQGAATGSALRRLGITVDLAPVADVKDGPRSFLGSRAFSSKPGVVAAAACGFVDGLGQGGVAGTLKHFPGLGRARGNTDFQRVRVTAPAAALTADLAAYDRCAATAPLVMMASATYPTLGLTQPAVMDPDAYALLAARGFKGLTISDAFDTPAIRGRKDPALRAVRAGLDLMLFGQNEAGAAAAYDELVASARAGTLDPAALQSSAGRIAALKTKLATPAP